MNSILGKLVDDRHEQRVITTIGAARDEAGEEHPKSSPVGQQIQEDVRGEQLRLKNLAGHRRALAAHAIHVAHAAAELGDADPLKVGADASQGLFIGMFFHA